ncbi:MAG TPA: glycosyltransferase [Silvibacterium sp.]|nr:glycosyltransferase [Silvibacterium sp.]
MKIAVVTIVYSSTACPSSLIATALSAHPHTIECHLFVHSTYPHIIQECVRFAQLPSVVYYPFGINRGVSRSWNEGMLAAYGAHADVVVVTNDDIVFAPGDLAKIAHKAAASGDRYIVSCAGFHHYLNCRIPSLGYACFAINPIAIQKLGCFDENIFPAYCEDVDYAFRARLAGLNEENCTNTMLRHVGSNSILSDPALRRQNAATHLLNLAYYRRKWGGDGGHERYKYPFNDPLLGYYISPGVRHAPYGPAYDRTDHDIVKM